MYEISTDPARLDMDVIHGYLCHESYWAQGIPRALLEKALANSLCFGIYAEDGTQAGFARVTTDRATFACLADVFVLPAHRGQGLSKRLLKAVTGHPELQGLCRWVLATADAHGLYRQFGFAPLARPERFMERRDPITYGSGLKPEGDTGQGC